MKRTQIAASLEKFIASTYETGMIRDERGVEHSIHPDSVSLRRGAFLHDLIRSERASVTLEIGMAWGLSTLAMVQALVENGARRRSHVVLDPHQKSLYGGAALRALRETGAAKFVEFHEENSMTMLPRLVERNRSFDIVFVDGRHVFDGVFLDFIYADWLVRPGGVIVLDDTFADPIHLTCRFAETNFEYVPVADVFAEDAPRDRNAYWRPAMRALRKPTVTPAARSHGFNFVPFFIDPEPEAEMNSGPETPPSDESETAAPADDVTEEFSVEPKP